LLGELDPLFDEGFAVDILVVDLIGADARFVGPWARTMPSRL
jgi:hypothetical protein